MESFGGETGSTLPERSMGGPPVRRQEFGASSVGAGANALHSSSAAAGLQDHLSLRLSNSLSTPASQPPAIRSTCTGPLGFSGSRSQYWRLIKAFVCALRCGSPSEPLRAPRAWPFSPPRLALLPRVALLPPSFSLLPRPPGLSLLPDFNSPLVVLPKDGQLRSLNGPGLGEDAGALVPTGEDASPGLGEDAGPLSGLGGSLGEDDEPSRFGVSDSPIQGLAGSSFSSEPDWRFFLKLSMFQAQSRACLPT